MTNDISQASGLFSNDAQENSFIAKCIQQYEEKILKRPLTILIWGPTEPPAGADEYKVNLYKKRVEIKEHLKSLGHNAFFSEEISKKARKRFNEEAFERIQIENADLAIMLRATPGTIGEFHDFHNDVDCARKMYVFFDKEHRQSYTHVAADRCFTTNGGKLEEFSYPTDIIACNLKAKINKHVKSVQVAIFLSPYKKY